MARTFSVFPAQLSPQGDLRTTPNLQIEIVEGLEALRQRTIMRLRFWQGEWPIAIDEGVPYIQEIFSRPVNSNIAATIITSIIRSDNEVTGIFQILTSFDPITRSFTYSCRVSSIFGDFPIDLTL